MSSGGGVPQGQPTVRAHFPCFPPAGRPWAPARLLALPRHTSQRETACGWRAAPSRGGRSAAALRGAADVAHTASEFPSLRALRVAAPPSPRRRDARWRLTAACPHAQAGRKKQRAGATGGAAGGGAAGSELSSPASAEGKDKKRGARFVQDPALRHTVTVAVRHARCSRVEREWTLSANFLYRQQPTALDANGARGS